MTLTSTLDQAAAAVAAHVVWAGHQGRDSILTAVGCDAAAIDRAVELGLIAEVPRLGGYTATRTTRARTFGRGFADAWEA